MIQDNEIRWVGALDATSGTQYRIEADKVTPGSFVTVTTVSAAAPYAPVQTTLNMPGGLSENATTVIVTDATGLAQNTVIAVGKERIRLGAPSGNTFNNCVRGVEGTLSETHSDGDTVYKSHESYVDADVDFGERHLIRYRVVRVQGAQESIAAEVMAFAHPKPTTNMCILYGVVESLDGGGGKEGVATELSINEPDNYGPDTGEVISDEPEQKDSDLDGYFYYSVRRDSARAGGGLYKLKVGNLDWNITNIPDKEYVNFLET